MAEGKPSGSLASLTNAAASGSGVGFWRWNFREECVVWSDELRRMFGLTANDKAPVSLTKFAELVHPDDRARVIATARETLTRQRPGHAHFFRVVWPDGQVRLLFSRAQLFIDAAGRAETLEGVDVDMTGLPMDFRAGGQAAAFDLGERMDGDRQGEKPPWPHGQPVSLLQTFMDNSASYAFAKDPDGRYIFANRHYLNAFGTTADDLLGRTDRDRFGTGDVYSANDKLVLETGKPIDFEESARGAGGRMIHAISTKFPLRDEEGQIFGVGSISTDITARKEAEEALVQSRETMSLALDAGRMGVWEIDLAAGKAVLDERMRRLYGLTDEAAEIPLEAYDAQIVEEDRAAAEEARRHTDEKGLFSAEYRICRADDRTIRWIRSEGMVHRDGEGRPLQAVGVSYDITKERGDADRLRLLNRELNHRVKNLFAMIQSVIQLSSQQETSVTGFVRKLTARVQALATAHLLSLEEDQRSLQVGEVVETVVAPHDSAATSRIMRDGPALWLPALAVTPFSLILHELATNAVKYGGLSAPAGGLEILWRVLDGEEGGEVMLLELTWQEQVPAKTVCDPGMKTGFGSLLIDGSIAQIGGQVARHWTEDGLRVLLRFPLHRELQEAR